MRRYERWNQYPYNTYGAENTVTLRDFPDRDWMEDHLIRRPHPRHPAVLMVGYQSYWIEQDHDGKLIEVAMCFEEAENKRRVIELLPELVIEPDPFGSDTCPSCGGPLPEPQPTRKPWWIFW